MMSFLLRALCLPLAVLLLPAAWLYGLFARQEDPERLARFRAGIRRCGTWRVRGKERPDAESFTDRAAGADIEAARRLLRRDGGQPPAPEDRLP